MLAGLLRDLRGAAPCSAARGQVSGLVPPRRDSHFHHTAGLATFLARNQFTPGLLIVAIPNTNRPRDLTPQPWDPSLVEQGPVLGGAEKFRSFLADEFVPWVDENYRARAYRILVGHSLGGLFAIDTLISRPELFNAYVAASPALQYDGQRLVERAEAFFGTTAKLDASLYVTAGNEGGALVGGIRRLAGVLDEKAPDGLEWHFEHMPTESHQSVPLRSTYHGLEFIYADWLIRNPIEIYETYGVDAIAQFYENSEKKYGDDRSALSITVRETALPFL